MRYTLVCQKTMGKGKGKILYLTNLRNAIITFKSNKTTVSERVLNEIQRLTEILELDKQKVESTFEKISEDVEKQWKSNKLSIVPGDLLIDMVCKEYGVRFKKEKDGSRLASFMKKDEIDTEIKNIIREIGCDNN